MKISYLILWSALCLALGSCKETDFMPYMDEDRIQFGPSNQALIYDRDYEQKGKFVDTTKTHTFFFRPESFLRDTLYFDVYTLGRVYNYDRPYKVVQVLLDGVDNAIPNVHYQAFDDQKSAALYVVKAGQAHVQVPVVLLRDPSMKQKTYVLKIELQANEHFQIGAVSNIWRKAIVTDRLTKPAAWNQSMTQYYLGEYSTKKHEFMIKVTGKNWDQAMMSTWSYDELMFYIVELKKALVDYNNLHEDEPLRDEFDNLIVFP